jgi:hypothetical protein
MTTPEREPRPSDAAFSVNDYTIWRIKKKREETTKNWTGGHPVVDSRGRLVGIFVRALSKSSTISELFTPVGREELKEHMSKAFAGMVFSTKFLYNRAEVSPVVSILDQLRDPVSTHRVSRGTYIESSLSLHKKECS